LKRAALLIKEITGGQIASEIVDVYPKPIKDFEVELNYNYLDRLIGTKIDRAIIKKILLGLEVKIVTEKKDCLQLSVPPFKADVTREADVIEEIVRIYGYNNIPTVSDDRRMPNTFSVPSTREDYTEKIKNVVSDFLSDNGFNEIISNSITQSKYFGKEVVQLLNFSKSAEAGVTPDTSVGTSAELDVLRPTMLFSGLEAIAYNINRQHTKLLFYEFGYTYHHNAKKYIEKAHLGLFLTAKHPASDSPFYQLKGYVENVLKKMGIQELKYKEMTDDIYQYGLKLFVGKEQVATLGKIQQHHLKTLDIKQEVFYADMDWDALLSQYDKEPITFKQIPKYPAVKRDLALVIDEQIAFEQIVKIAKETGKKLLKAINLLSIYRDKKLGANKKSYAVSFTFQDETKTLTDEEVDKIMDIMMGNRALKAIIRK